MKKPRKLFFGWWINIITSFVTTINGGLTGAASLLFKPIAADLHMDRTGASVASGIGTLVNGGVFALAGWLTDKYGARWVVFTGTLIAGFGMIGLSWVQNPWQYYLIWGVVITIGLASSVSISIDTMLANWFVRKRGLAFSIRFSIIGTVTSAILPLITWLIQTQGWRQTAFIWGIITLCSIPVLLVFVKPKRPEYYGWLPDGAALKNGARQSEQEMITSGQEYAANLQEVDFTFRQVVRTPSYWIINLAWVFLAITWGGFSLHLVPYLTDRGITMTSAGIMLAVMAFIGLPSRIISGIIADRLKKEHIRYLMVGALAVTTVGMAALLLVPNIAGVYLLIALYGMGTAVYTPMDILIRARYFGRKAYGRVQGMATIFSAPVSFAAPIFTGWIYDSTGKYTIAFILFTVLTGLSAFTLLFARVPKPLPPELNNSRIGSIK